MKKKLFLFTILIVCQYVFSQEESSKIKVYSPEETTEKENSKIKVYSPNATTEKDSYKWVVKTDLLGFLVGEFPVILEHRITDKISVEGSVGFTYAFGSDFLLKNDEFMDDSNNTEASYGSAFRLGFKYYPSTDWDAIEGWSFGIQAFIVNDNRSYSEYELNNYNFKGLKDTQKTSGAMITISKQIFWDSNISIEYLLGIGIASFKHESQNIDYNSHKIINEIERKTSPKFKLGARIGFGN